MSAISLLPPDKNQPQAGAPSWKPGIFCAILNPVFPLTDCRWTLALPRILQQCPPGSIMLSDWRYGVGTSREALLHSALSSPEIGPKLTHILFLDSDTIPDDGAIFKLFEADKDIVAGIYFNSLLTGLAAWIDEQALRIENLRGRENPLIQCQKVGMGLCLFKASVFRFLEEKQEERPYFYYKLDARANSMLSEDFYFFQKCLKYGIKPWIHLGARCLHLKTVGITPEGSVAGPAPVCPNGQRWNPITNRCEPDPNVSGHS